MGPSALTSLLESLATAASPVVRARRGQAWDEGGDEFGADVRALAAALVGYGLSPGSCAAVMGSEGCDTLRAELAVFAAGASLVSVDPAVTDEVLYGTLASSGVVQAIASDEKQLARILALRPELPALDLVLLMRAEPSERRPAALLSLAAIQVGAATLKDEPSMLRAAVSAGESSQALVVVRADGRVLRADRATFLRLADRIATMIGAAPGRMMLSALPIASVPRLAAALAVTGRAATLLLADPAARPDSGLGEQKVDVVLLSPDALKQLRIGWQAELDGRSWVGRTIARWSLRQGADPARAGWKYRIADALTLRDLRRRLGGRVTGLDVLGEGPVDADRSASSFFEAIGLPVRYLDVESAAKPGPVIAVS